VNGLDGRLKKKRLTKSEPGQEDKGQTVPYVLFRAKLNKLKENPKYGKF